MNENLSQIELNIRASWALNCAVAMGKMPSDVRNDVHDELLQRAEMFLGLLDEVKAVIRPPLKETKGRSPAEVADIKKTAREGTMIDFANGL